MSLSPAAKQRYARQILLREIGEEGQARLLHARFGRDESSDSQAYGRAADYLRRAGCAEDCSAEPLRVPSSQSVDAFAGGEPRYREAAATVLGSLSAVEFLKDALELPKGGELPRNLTLLGKQAKRPC